MSVVGLVLAAGAARRMGRPKQLAELGGRPLLEHVLTALACPAVDRVVVALGARAGEVAARVDLHGAATVVVSDWDQGMGHVLAQAVGRLGPDCQAVVVLLGDQPLVTPAAVERVVRRWRSGAGPVVGAAYGGRPGHPKLFDRAVLGELARLGGDSGARDLLAAHPDWVTAVEVGDVASDIDIDDEDGLARLDRALAGRRP